MKINIDKIWLGSFNFIREHPVVLVPFIIIAFFETLILEIANFCTRKPLAMVFVPIVRKFFGEQFLHYPENFTLVPKLFNLGQIVIYILVSVFLTAVAVQIFFHIKNGSPIVRRAIVKNSAKKYMAFIGYGLIFILVMIIIERSEGFLFLKAAKVLSRHTLKMPAELFRVGSSLIMFFTNVISQVFLILTIPIIIIEKKKFLKAILGSIILGARNFLKVLWLILLPFFFYVPVFLAKTFMPIVMDKTFPEISFYVTLFGILISIFVDCFIIISAAQFLLETKKTK
jgi:hypothetical protein